jgi:glutathione S-transferase
MTLKFYYAPLTRSFRVLWLLEEIGEPYERVHIDIRKGEQSTDKFRAINPMAKVPALTDGDASMAESGAISAYLADRFPEAGLAPPIGDPRRGRYLQWLFFSAGGIEPAITQTFMKFELPSSQAGWGDAERVWSVLEDAVQPGPWLLGDMFTAADVLIGSDLNLVVNQFKILEGKPAINAFIARCTERPAFQRALALDQGDDAGDQ